MSEVRVGLREIYDAVQGLDRKLTQHMASTEVRLTHLEDATKARAGRGWQVWLAVLGSLVSLPVAIWAASQGVS